MVFTISGGPHRLVGYTCDGREVMASVDGHQVSLAEVANTTVWVALLVDTCLPFVELRKTLAVECTGLGGAELGSPTPWDLLVRTGRHHEEVRGPSLARLEFTGVVNEVNARYVGLAWFNQGDS